MRRIYSEKSGELLEPQTGKAEGNQQPSWVKSQKVQRLSEEDTSSLITDLSARTDYAWLAGIVDGEGCISLRKNGNGKGFHPHIEIDNTDLSLILKAYEITKVFNARFYKTRPSHRDILCKRTLYRLGIGGKNAVELLRKLLPYLTSKSNIAGKIINFFSSKKKYSYWNEEMINRYKNIFCMI